MCVAVADSLARGVKYGNVVLRLRRELPVRAKRKRKREREKHFPPQHVEICLRLLNERLGYRLSTFTIIRGWKVASRKIFFSGFLRGFACFNWL